MSAEQIEDVALSLEYVKQYRGSHSNLNANQGYLLEQCVVWQRLSEQLGWQCDNVRAAYSEISQDIQNEVYTGARAFVQANKGRYKCGGYIYTGEGQDLGQFWAELNVGNAKVKRSQQMKVSQKQMQCIPLQEQLLAYSQTRIAVIRLEHLQQMRMARQMKWK